MGSPTTQMGLFQQPAAPMAFDEPEDTRLIDVSDLQTQMGGDFAQEETVQEPMPATTDPAIVPPVAAPAADPPAVVPERETGPTRLATLGERFTALCIDSLVLWCLYWAGVQLYGRLTDHAWSAPAPTNLALSGLAFHGGFALLAWLYYFLGEGIFSTTIGKLPCRMAVRRSDGRIASLGSVMLRNLFRPLDYLLGPFTLAILEFTAQHQRIGDLIANTIVIKRQRTHPQTPVAWDQLASSTGRLAAGMVDLLLLAGVVLGGIMMLSSAHAFRSQWIILAGPGLLCLILALLQTLTHTTPGGWCFGYRLVQENGAPVGFTHTFLRTCFLPVDLCCGAFAVVLSPRRQRIGDMVAGTLVVRAPRTLRGVLSPVALGLLLAAVSTVAWQNPAPWINRNLQLSAPGTWINADFRLTFIPRTELFPDFPAVQPGLTPFRIVAFRFAEGTPDNARSPAVYVPGETAFFVFDIDGFRTTGNQVWVQQDLAVRYPDHTFGLRQENIIDHQQIKRVPGPLVLKNSINLPHGLPAGHYTVFITLRDQFGGGPALVREESFFIKEVLAKRVTPPSLETESPQSLPAPGEPTPTPPAAPVSPGAIPAPE